MSSAKWSCPAGTGVCVVNTVLEAAASSAAAKGHVLRHQVADALEHQEGCVALVDVPYGRAQLEFGQGASAADTEQDFLLDPGAPVAAVELVSNAPVGFAVFRQVGVEQVEAVVAHPRAPDLGPHRASREVDADVHFAAVRVAHGFDRHVVEIVVAVMRGLVALAVYGLVEIALAVEQADGDEGQAHVGGALAVVAGKDAEAAGVDRQALVEAELGAEIGDQVGGLQGRPPRQLQPRFGVIGIEGRQHPVHGAEEHGIVGGFVDPLLVHALEEGLGAVVHGAPEAGAEAGEQRAGGTVPAVPEVVGDFVEPREAGRYRRIDFELMTGAGHDVGP
jgi:hypothetical protein